MDPRQCETHPGLTKYVLHNVERTGVKLGAGSFGSVEEVLMSGTTCAGKVWHEILLDPNNEGVENMIQRFIRECELMSQVHHPNIVQFMGICFMPSSPYPILVMEKLSMSLDRLLSTQKNLPLRLKLDVLLDVSKGLVHLHCSMKPPIVHRDLTTCNVLLDDSLKAKIADLGNARMIEPGKLSKTLSNSPGTQVYMPPEAAGVDLAYDSSLDIFSFGHMALYTVTEVFPGNLLPATYTDPNTHHLFPRSELERRHQYIQKLHSKIGKNHILTAMIKDCLSNSPTLRPTADVLLSKLRELTKKYEGGRPKIENLLADGQRVYSGVYGEKPPPPPNSPTYAVLDVQIGVPDLLYIYKTFGNVLNRKKGWKQYTFTITDTELYYQKANKERILSRIPLSSIYSVNAINSSQFSDPSMFYFEIGFKGIGSPWLLKTHTLEKRVSWMNTLVRTVAEVHTESYTSLSQTRAPTTEASPGDEGYDVIPPPESAVHMKLPTLPPTPSVQPPEPAPDEYDEYEYDDDDDDDDDEFEAEHLYEPDPWSTTKCTNPEQVEDETIYVDSVEHLGATSPPPALPPPAVPEVEDLYDDLGQFIPEAEPEPVYDVSSLECAQEQQDDEGYERLPHDSCLAIQPLPPPPMPPTTPKSPALQTRPLPERPLPEVPDISLLRTDSYEEIDFGDEESESDDDDDDEGEEINPYPQPPPSNKNVDSDDSASDNADEGRYDYIANDEIPFLPDPMHKIFRSVSANNLETIRPRLSSTIDPANSQLQLIIEQMKEMREMMVQLQNTYAQVAGRGLPDIPADIPEKRDQARRSLSDDLESSPLRKEDQATQNVDKEDTQTAAGKTENATREQMKKVFRDLLKTTPLIEEHQLLITDEKSANDDNLIDAPWSRASITTQNISSDDHHLKLKALEISPSKISDKKPFRKGNFGDVYSAKLLKDNKEKIDIAIKVVKNLNDQRDRDDFEREQSIMSQMKHPNIVELYGIVYDQDDITPSIVLEYLPYGDLKNFLKANQRPIKKLVKYMLDVSMGMNYISKMQLVHRDLAARNVILGADETCKVGDFGLLRQMHKAKRTESLYYAAATKDTPLPIRWMAPESLDVNKKHFSTASDVWSFGIVQWEMMNPKKTPYKKHSDDEVRQRVVFNNLRPTIPSQYPTEIKSIMKACWNQDPSKRPSFFLISNILTRLTFGEGLDTTSQ